MLRWFDSGRASATVAALGACLLAGAAACTSASVGADGDGDGGDDADAAFEAEAGDNGGDAALEVGIACDPDKIISPVLTVLDAVTGRSICNAMLVDSPDDSLFPCVADEGCTADCQYTLAEFGGSATATFSVTVTAPGFEPTKVSEITPTQCGCEAGLCLEAQGLTASLVPVDAGTSLDAGHDAAPDARLPDATVPDATLDAALDAAKDAPLDVPSDSPAATADAHVGGSADGRSDAGDAAP